MSEELTHEQVVDQLPGYVLGALEPDEMIAMDSHLQKQRELLSLLHETEEALVHLAHSAPEVPLPTDAKARLMGRVRSERTRTEPRGLTRFFRMPAALWQQSAAAAAILLFALSFYTLQLQGEVAQLRREQEVLQQVRQEQLRWLAGARQAVVLPGTEEAPAAYGALYRSEAEAMILFEGLAVLPEEQTYQLWLIPADGDPIPAGLLTVQEGMSGWHTISIPPGAEDFAAVGVSVEPAGGSLAPTGPIVLLGQS